MMRWALFTLGLACAAIGLLTVFRSPDWLNWRLAVLAGQFGYLFAVVPLGAGVVALCLPAGRSPLAVATGATCAAAVVLLVQPCAQAWMIGRNLPARFDRLFGKAEAREAAFAFGGLVRRWPAPVSKSTWTYSGSLQLDFGFVA